MNDDLNEEVLFYPEDSKRDHWKVFCSNVSRPLESKNSKTMKQFSTAIYVYLHYKE